MRRVMRNRSHLLLAASAGLYLGPVLAGWTGAGWEALPAFAAIFLLWLIVMRPQAWPRDPAAWKRPEVVAGAVLQALVQPVLAGLCLGLGWGIATLSGVQPALPVAVPLALSALAVPLSRLVWDPVKAAELDDLLDDALRQLNASPGDADEQDATLIAPLLGLTAETPDAVLQKAAAGLMGQPGIGWYEVYAALDVAGEAALPACRGMILWGTDPQVVAETRGTVQQAFEVTWNRPDLLKLFLARAEPLLAADPGLWLDFPDARSVRYAIDDSNPPALNADLGALADRLEQAAPVGDDA